MKTIVIFLCFLVFASLGFSQGFTNATTAVNVNHAGAAETNFGRVAVTTNLELRTGAKFWMTTNDYLVMAAGDTNLYRISLVPAKTGIVTIANQ